MDIQSLPEICSELGSQDIEPYSENSLNDNFENTNENLEKRLGCLKDMMENLRTELSRERELWKKEVEEVAKLSAYQAQQQLQQQQQDVCTCCADEESVCSAEPTLNDITILDYEQKLNVYQQALAKAHTEKRMHLRRHLAANAYKTKLLELENMCNRELQNVKQNVQNLQPLQAIASEWNFEDQQQGAELSGHLDDEITGGSSKKDLQSQKECVLELEAFGNKITNEIKELAARISPPESTLETSSIQDEDDDLMLRRLQSVGWYWYNYPFNPLM